MKILLSALLFSCSVFAADLSPIGVWLTADKDAKVEIYKSGENLEGKIVWLQEPKDKEGKEKVDTKNPDEALRTRPLMNLVLLKDFKKDKEENKWSGGTIYDAKTGKTYKSWFQMLDEKNMKLRGFIGFSLIGKTTEWTRDESKP